MTPFVKWVKKLRDKWFGEWEEGPDPPQRLREMTISFANDNPRATRDEWVEFSAGLAEECYRSGYIRGFDYTERTHDWRTDVPPEVLADWIDPEWRWQRGIELVNPELEVPTDEPTDNEIMKRQMDEVLISSARRS